jgi:hypothetical protein
MASKNRFVQEVSGGAVNAHANKNSALEKNKHETYVDTNYRTVQVGNAKNLGGQHLLEIDKLTQVI